jgi:hypothetical protein
MSSETESVSDHEVEALARTYGTTVEKVRAVIASTGTRSIRRIQEALEQQGADQPATESGNADSRAVDEATSTSGEVTFERDGRTYAATYTVDGDMVHVKTHTETRSVALNGRKPEDIARRELEQIVEASRRH